MSRKETILEVFRRARDESRKVYMRKRKLVAEARPDSIPEAVKYVCVEGDAEWTRLPDKETQS